nr:hypothetical protein [Tanacetum cinerariifolium]
MTFGWFMYGYGGVDPQGPKLGASNVTYSKASLFEVVFLLLVHCAMTSHPNVTVPLLPNFRGVTDWYQEPRRPQEELEEELEEKLEVDAVEDTPSVATQPVGSPITPLPLLESSSDSEATAPVVANGTHKMAPLCITFGVGGPSSVSLFPPFHLYGHEIKMLRDDTEMLFSNVKYLERSEKRLQTEIDVNSPGVLDQDLSHEVQFASGVEGRVTRLEDKDQENMDKLEKIEKCLETLEANYALVLSDRDRLKRDIYSM